MAYFTVQYMEARALCNCLNFVMYNSGLLHVTVKSHSPTLWLPNCHGSTSRMCIKWLWICLSRM